MKTDKVTHLSKEDIIKNGSIFTPKDIVEKAKEYVLPYIDENSVIIDFGAGYGAFISEFLDCKGKKVATDIDDLSCMLLEHSYEEVDVRQENSLVNVLRENFANEEENIIVVGNPPYNDVTSQYQKGQKGNVECDEDLYARDMGISFLKMYDKIEAKAVCVLHPFSYLLKKSNFNSLKSFKDHYVLKKADIFSSQRFESINKSNAEFPVLIALYERSSSGMDYEYIRNFEFGIYESEEKFKIANFKTIDGVVNKYPSKDKKDSDLQFYTLRDINALKRNKTFLTGKCNNGIKVSNENLHYYAWLDFFKYHFVCDNMHLYGNLSPFLANGIEKEEFKKELYGYILNNNEVVKSWYLNNDLEFYNKNKDNKYDIKKFKRKIKI